MTTSFDLDKWYSLMTHFKDRRILKLELDSRGKVEQWRDIVGQICIGE